MKLIQNMTQARICMQECFEEVAIQDCAKLSLQIVAEKRRRASLLVTYDGSNSELAVDIELQEGCEAAILFWNKSQENVTMGFDIHGQKDAHAHIGIGDLDAGKCNYQIESNLDHAGMDVHVTTVSLAGKKHFQIAMNHLVGHTSSLMENFAVVQENGDYLVEASDRIVKGARESASHQASRVLTLSQKQKSEVLPILYIDENEVKASHATTLGQPDETQLYYLQSRGLSRKAALGLLTFGYLMPITQVIEIEEVQGRLQAEIEEKVILHD